MSVLITLFWIGLIIAVALFVFRIVLMIVFMVIGLIVGACIWIYEKLAGN